MSTDASGDIVLHDVVKRFGDVAAVAGVSLNIRSGEFFSLLGPSGCGKTTTLRMIAGFEEPTSGQILLRGEDVTHVGAAKRNLNLVFQEYALFPHMTVTENVRFGLKIKKVPKQEAQERVDDMLAAMQLTGLHDRRPGQLSGGQRQRVALARALVNRPAALLLDEPLGALDFKLRKDMQLELKGIQQRTGTTFVYVTHDQEEALTMSDRIAVMNGGHVEQVADPQTLYECPATPFVADFIGISNLLRIRVDARGDGCLAMHLGDGDRLLAPDCDLTDPELQVTVRPEKIHLDPPDQPDWARVHGRLVDRIYLGSMTQLVVELRTGETLVVHHLNEDAHERPLVPGVELVLGWPARSAFVIGTEPPAKPTPASSPPPESTPPTPASPTEQPA
jgi:spermidine/putrescine transport system ATP-binding protein